MDDGVSKADEFVEFLEKLVQCLKRPTNWVPMYLRGDNVCQSCRDLLCKCPTCKCYFSGSRNFVVEELCAKIADIIVLLLESQLLNFTPMMSRSMQTDDPMIQCRIGSCPDLLPPDRMYHHLRDSHTESLFKVNAQRGIDGSWCCSKIWEVKYVLDKVYDFALYAGELGIFFVNLYINEDGDLLAALRLANPRRDDKLYYDMALYVPGKKLPVQCSGTVQECSSTYFQPCEYKKRFFAYYFEADFVTLNNRGEKPFTLALFIQH